MQGTMERRPVCCSAMASFVGLFWTWPDPIRTGVPFGALRTRWFRPVLTESSVLYGRVRSTTVIGGGGCSLPRGRGAVDP